MISRSLRPWHGHSHVDLHGADSFNPAVHNCRRGAVVLHAVMSMVRVVLPDRRKSLRSLAKRPNIAIQVNEQHKRQYDQQH